MKNTVLIVLTIGFLASCANSKKANSDSKEKAKTEKAAPAPKVKEGYEEM